MDSLDDVHTLATPTIPHMLYVLTEKLPAFIVEKSKKTGAKHVKLLVVDALAELFHTTEKTTKMVLIDRAKNLAQISTLLHSLANKHQIAVLVLNEVVDVFERENRQDAVDGHLLYSEQSRWFGRAHSIPGENRKEASLGLAWANQVNARILLSRTGRRRYLDNNENPRAKRPKLDDSTSSSTVPSLSTTSTEDLTLIRRFSVIFSSVSKPISIDYIVTEAGLTALSGDDHASVTNEGPAPSVLSSIAELPPTPVVAETRSEISPLDIGTVEESRSVDKHTFQNRGDAEEDEWETYWSSNDISAVELDGLPS
ncbi:hypothetical protein H0H81_002963 [Sphagnurus paluster]|uniref:Rad51-like C-terminal domain-containing protein n=1 Tax=Sphagnurus paluster TaxID=117069 RepID=A0A9P7GPA3_9AGAR|nr:hypothetical protein H0H81_002963 [Sphagnurus paluster]